MHNTTKTRTDNIGYLINQAMPIFFGVSALAVAAFAATPFVTDSKAANLNTLATLFAGGGVGAYAQKRQRDSQIVDDSDQYNINLRPQNVYQSSPPRPWPVEPPQQIQQYSESQEDWVAPEYRK